MLVAGTEGASVDMFTGVARRRCLIFARTHTACRRDQHRLAGYDGVDANFADSLWLISHGAFSIQIGPGTNYYHKGRKGHKGVFNAFIKCINQSLVDCPPGLPVFPGFKQVA